MVYQIALEDAALNVFFIYRCSESSPGIRTYFYHLAILDIKMPKLDGFTLCEKIRELDRSLQSYIMTTLEIKITHR